MTVLGKIKSFFKRPKGEPKAEQAKPPAEAADALAVALCHLQEVHLKNLLAEQ